jgi:hypothetical protein
MRVGNEILQALDKRPMTIMELWRTTGLPFRRVQDHVHRVLRASGRIQSIGKRGYYTLYARSSEPGEHAEGNGSSGRVQGSIRRTAGNVCVGERHNEGEAA